MVIELDREDKDSRLEVLVTDYTVLREDQHALDQVNVNLFSVAVALISAIAILLLKSCADARVDRCEPVIWPPLYAALPLGPLAVLSFLGAIANTMTIRSFYLRLIERELWRVGDRPSAQVGGTVIPLPSFTHFTTQMVSQRRGFTRYRFMSFLIYLAIGVLFIGTTTLSLMMTTPIDLRIGAGIFYAVSTAVLIRVLWFGSLGGRTFWHSLVHGLPDEWNQPLDKKPTPPCEVRSLFSYLLLPRPEELLVKGPILIVTILLSTLASGTLTVALLGHALVFFLAFEFLLYQARYIWNGAVASCQPAAR